MSDLCYLWKLRLIMYCWLFYRGYTFLKCCPELELTCIYRRHNLFRYHQSIITVQSVSLSKYDTINRNLTVFYTSIQLKFLLSFKRMLLSQFNRFKHLVSVERKCLKSLELIPNGYLYLSFCLSVCLSIWILNCESIHHFQQFTFFIKTQLMEQIWEDMITYPM